MSVFLLIFIVIFCLYQVQKHRKNARDTLGFQGTTYRKGPEMHAMQLRHQDAQQTLTHKA